MNTDQPKAEDGAALAPAPGSALGKDKMKMTSNEMEYTIYQRADGKWDVSDAGGNRPLGLRGNGPWNSEDEAAEAVRSMTPEEAAE